MRPAPHGGSLSGRDELITEELVYDALLHMNDNAYLQGHPLADLTSAPGRQRGESLRATLMQALDSLKPPDTTPADHPAWRPWQALSLRFAEQHSPIQVQESMGLSERQVRREQSRGITAMVGVLRDVLAFPLSPEKLNLDTPGIFRQAADALEVLPSELDAREVLVGVARMLSRRLDDTNVSLLLPEQTTLVYADRITLRQVLARVLGELAPRAAGGTIRADILAQGSEVAFRFQVIGCAAVDLEPTLLQECNYLADLSLGRVAVTESDTVVCSFPARRPALLLLLDDEPVALQLLRRCLQGQGVEVIPVEDAAQVVDEAADLRPDVVILDVLMPGRDGWEVLQQLKSTPETSDIPVIVCSVWRDPNLALALGAAEFIRKPVTRPRLLSALARILPSIVAAESRPDSS